MKSRWIHEENGHFRNGHMSTPREEIKLRIFGFVKGLFLFLTFPIWLPFVILLALIQIVFFDGDPTGRIDYGAPVVRVEPWNQS